MIKYLRGIIMNEKELNIYYNKFNEEKRFNSRHGKVEFITTMKYIKEYLKPNYKIIDIGAGSGRYSKELVDLGYNVTPVELVKQNIRKIEKIGLKPIQGNAINLSMFKDNTFDIVLLFGPMYHLISYEEKIKALKEAKRICKKDGIIMISYIMNEYAIIKHGFMEQTIINSIDNGLVNDNFKITPKFNDLYSYVRLEDIDKLNSKVKLKRIKIISQDTLSNYLRPYINKLTDEEFGLYLKYHLSICERYENLGLSTHILDILKNE